MEVLPNVLKDIGERNKERINFSIKSVVLTFFFVQTSSKKKKGGKEKKKCAKVVEGKKEESKADLKCFKS